MRLFTKKTISNFKGEPYLVRYTLFSCRWFGIFIHKILRSDDDRELHDHPWNFCTLILRGGYREEVPYDSPPMFQDGRMIVKSKWRGPGSFIQHRAEDAHRLELCREVNWNDSPLQMRFVPTWTLFIHGRRKRQWGFHTAAGWMDWITYIAENRDTDTSPMEN